MPKNKKHIVIITTWFPPIQSVAVNRMVAFAKYFDKEKYEISILTLHQEGAKEKEEMYNCNIYRLKNDSFFNLPIFNSKDNKIKHKFKVVWKLLLLKIQKDLYSNWIKNTANKLEKIHQEKPIDLILSSYAPVAPHIVTLTFLNKNPQVKWIADMRDEMSQNELILQKEKKYLESVEKEVNQKASAIITVSEPIVKYFNKLFPNIQKIEEIRNGFDCELSDKKYTFNNEFSMLYAGNFYGTRKPNTLFQALQNIKKKLPLNWKIIFLGTTKNFNVPAEFKNNVIFLNRVPQKISLEYMEKTDVNLLIHPGGKRKGVFTGKLFDYLAVKKPILGIIDTQDVAAKLIKELNMGFIAEFDDINAIEIALLNLIKIWKNKTPLNFNEKGIEKLHRKYQVEKTEILIDKILNEQI